MAVAIALVLFGASAAALYAVRRYVRERDELRKVRALFSRYVPVQVVNELLERDSRVLSAQTVTATIVSCRIRNFALFAEDLSAEQTLHALNEFHALAGAAIEKQQGIIESLHGDGITAVFGVLIDSPFQEERALRAALTIVRLVSALDTRWREHGYRPFSVTIGVHTGSVVAGDIGYQRRREFAVIGNAAHVATRLQDAAEDLNASILATEETFAPVRDIFVGVPTSPLPLRGLKRLPQAYIVRGVLKREESALTIKSPERLTHTIVEPAPVHAAEPPFFAMDSALPAVPELPRFAGIYEDGQGPPMQLG
ncbi:MAG: adenylate/guanylate cyclase domain-containing protein [Candidatus Eremiobacteraeota bacterium]|nr:adenylate/guanylate cyclase domain-containing protein [Candidatus Eremiobacteraeota bacterium]